ETILAVHPGALGDVILFGHLLGRLGGAVTLVAGGEKARLLAGAGVVAGAMDFDALPMHEVFLDGPPRRGDLAGLLGRYDRLVSCFAAGAPPAERRLAELCGATEAHFLPTRPPEEFRGHLLQWWAGLLGSRAGPGGGPSAPAATAAATAAVDWSIPPAWREGAARLLEARGVDCGGDYLAVGVGAGAARKCWPLERFIELARRCRAEGLPAVMPLGPAELERIPPAGLADLRRAAVVIEHPPLTALAGLLAAARAYVGNDSGVTHLAAALAVPTVALFGPSRADHFRPLGAAVSVLAAGTMEEIGLASVLAALRGRL
ncbi:MAG: hypothetical protein J7M21_03585, partial [Planctomycetes bacterium]|nr:hypothetical protein [Planctomycetota bacterium]